MFYAILAIFDFYVKCLIWKNEEIGKRYQFKSNVYFDVLFVILASFSFSSKVLKGS